MPGKCSICKEQGQERRVAAAASVYQRMMRNDAAQVQGKCGRRKWHLTAAMPAAHRTWQGSTLRGARGAGTAPGPASRPPCPPRCSAATARTAAPRPRTAGPPSCPPAACADQSLAGEVWAEMQTNHYPVRFGLILASGCAGLISVLERMLVSPLCRIDEVA